MSINSDIKQALGTPECSVCYEPIKIPIELGCGHVFDYLCITTWWRKCPENSDSQTCPLDRSPFSFQKVKEALFKLPEGAEFRSLMANYTHYHNTSAELQLTGETKEENEKNRQTSYDKVNAFVEAHPEFMDFLPLNWF